MRKKLFLTNDVNGLPMNSIQEFDAVEAQKIQSVGHGVIVDLPSLDNIENEIAKKVDAYRKKYDEIRNSDNPVYKVEGAIEYYSAELQESLEKEVTELQEKYETIVNSMREEAKRDFANKTRNISDKERAESRDLINEAIANVKYGAGFGALDTLIEQAPYFSDIRKKALLTEIVRLSEATSNHPKAGEIEKKISRLYGIISEVNNGEMLPIQIANAINGRADQSFRTLKMTHQSFKNMSGNIHGNGSRVSAFGSTKL